MSQLWTLNEFVQNIKDDLQLHDLPSTVSDEDIIKRIQNYSLKEFSIIYARKEKFRLAYNDLLHPDSVYRARSRGVEYAIPKWFLMQFTPICVIDLEPYLNRNFYGDVMPYSLGYEPDMLITDVSCMKGMAGMAGNLANAPTYDYDSTNQTIVVYSSYTQGAYEVTMGVMHDINLSTIPPTAMLSFKDLATYDVGSYIFSKIFRKDNVETGIGTINLNIDFLRDCKSKHDDLLKELTEEASLDMDTIEFF